MVSKTAFKHLGEIKEKEKNKEKHKIYKNETKKYFILKYNL